ncbi:hypothetical protein [Streptomyces sp. NPDC101150]|uniref:hypothetical protein n=1 Tax=Streptomyces sp. NPDC101150 TaxID=3366114 RepID=UPI003828DC02
MTGTRLNVAEARHRLAAWTFFGQRGELRRHFRPEAPELGAPDGLLSSPGAFGEQATADSGTSG